MAWSAPIRSSQETWTSKPAPSSRRSSRTINATASSARPRTKALPTSAETINHAIFSNDGARLCPPLVRWTRGSRLCPGVPVLVERNDYERGLYNGDLGLVIRADDGQAVALYAAFKRRGAWSVFPARLTPGASRPAFAMTVVHKAQGSEHDEVVVVLPGRRHAHADARVALHRLHAGPTRGAARRYL